MLNFEFKNPTKILFGKGEIAKISKEIPQDAKILMIYGGGSIKNNGVYDQVKEALKDHELHEFGGVPANPEYEVLINAISFIKENNINYLLAVGGGSVIDGTKFISAAANYNGEPWDILRNQVRTFEGEGMPFGCILTLPATGSEMNSGYVISRRETNEKLSSGGPGLFPQFSVLDPEVIRSIPKNQIVNGITDAYTHVLEQYMTAPSSADLQERIAESILISLQETAPKVLADDFNYDAAGNFMWCCTMALNGLIQKGVITDWAVHAMGHELTAYFGIDHARTLAVIAPSHYRYNFEDKKGKLAQYAERVWGIKEGSIEEKAELGIKKLEEFFHSLNIKTKLSEYTEDYNGTAERVEKAFTDRNWLGLGEYKKLTPQDASKIVEMSY
ncbi:iron-containing alcohol dehydrogenase [Chryseobacterium jejuense]|uniref:Alcohol dehydrogenase YqhD n=1 Tax=Chryseobacterium jejuense TaxID=445960 RepID=A0A2X2XLM2_CHRJE|nr:iron-containing alcohol dehydrogenase [Chryseobacterium jejuense]SDI24858.1 NADP-dependent alcohol dehydrogenase [Chryseobacterium jejuense]SQB26679.1 Alcohol dehydrogenase YqhD [Chryseobacterium jejuense]